MQQKKKTKRIKRVPQQKPKKAVEEAIQSSKNTITINPSKITGFGILSNYSYYNGSVGENFCNLWVSYVDDFNVETVQCFEVYPEDAEKIKNLFINKTDKELSFRVKEIVSSTCSLIEDISEDSIKDMYYSDILRKMGIFIVKA